MNVPNVNRKEWQLVDIDDEGYLNLMDDSGDCREDLKAGDDNLAQEIQAKFDDGDDEGYLNLMDDSGDCREDLKAGDDNLAQEIQAKFDDGDDVFVTVLSA